MSTNEIKTVEKIRNTYVAYEPTKLDELKALNKRVKRPAKIFAYVFGSLGSLVLGTGMCLAMKVIFDLFALGIVIGCVGIFLVSINYPLYKSIIGRRKRKYASKIRALSNEILN